MTTEQQAALPKGIAEVREAVRNFHDLFDQAAQYIGLNTKPAEFRSQNSHQL